ncbi:MAG: transposase [Thermoleophilia bacterium]|nr:transposase [Thermoleophilia bacterium]
MRPTSAVRSRGCPDGAAPRCLGRLAARLRASARQPGAKVITDGWQCYRGLEKLGYAHERRSQRAARVGGKDPGDLLPASHRVASPAKRWLLGTHQGSVNNAHLASYLNEFVFRFNRRSSRSRGMLFYRVLDLAVAHDPVRYQDLIAGAQPRAVPPPPPQARGHPRAWSALQRTARGELPISIPPVKWIPPQCGKRG